MSEEAETPPEYTLDLETYGSPNDFDDDQRKYLIDRAKRRDEEPFADLALHPLTSRIVSASLYNTITGRGEVYYLDPTHQTANPEAPYASENVTVSLKTADGSSEHEAPFKLFAFHREAIIIDHVWQVLEAAKSNSGRVITWNGRSFDIPFLNVRTAVCGMRYPMDLLGSRFDVDNLHVDMVEVLTNYGALSRMNLDFTCRAFHVPSPKQSGMTGASVSEAFEAKEYRKIALYNAGDALAEGLLWVKRIRPTMWETLVRSKASKWKK